MVVLPAEMSPCFGALWPRVCVVCACLWTPYRMNELEKMLKAIVNATNIKAVTFVSHIGDH